MQDQLKSKAHNLSTTPAAINAFNGVKTAYRLAEILVPIAMTIYLVMKFDDLLILTIAGGLVVFAAVKLIRAVWLSVTLQNKKRK
jgi:hypothetical protein